MVKGGRILERFERDLVRRRAPDIAANFRLVESMRREARALGVFPSKNPLDGIEVDLKIAKVVNGVPRTP